MAVPRASRSVRTGGRGIVNNRTEIFQRSSSDPKLGYWSIAAGAARDIGIGPTGYPWIIGTSSMFDSYSIFAWNDEDANWKERSRGGIADLRGSECQPWVIDAGHNIFRAYPKP